MFVQTFCVLSTLIQAIYSDVEPCKQTDPCRCQAAYAGVNLHSLDASGYPTFQVIDGDVQYTYSPCKGQPCGQGVSNISLCASSTTTSGTLFKDLGDMKSFLFRYDTVSLRWSLSYHSKANSTNSTVELNCAMGMPDSFKVVSFNTTHYRFSLTSTCFCPGGCSPVQRGLSPGSVLLLIFFSVLLLYFGVGTMYRKTVYGAEGREIIPHNSFWLSLPGLIRDGYLFFISPCLGERVEYRYYDRL